MAYPLGQIGMRPESSQTINKEKYIQNQKGGVQIEPKFLRAEEVAQELSVSKPYAYKLIRQLNEELKAKGFITISGRINREYFNERLYGARKEN